MINFIYHFRLTQLDGGAAISAGESHSIPLVNVEPPVFTEKTLPIMTGIPLQIAPEGKKPPIPSPTAHAVCDNSKMAGNHSLIEWMIDWLIFQFIVYWRFDLAKSVQLPIFCRGKEQNSTEQSQSKDRGIETCRSSEDALWTRSAGKWGDSRMHSKPPFVSIVCFFHSWIK